MKFFILGDSWGVGEWTIDNNGIFESIPNTGLDYWLREHAHLVTNISAGSAGNFGQLRHAYWTLDQHSDYDYIIWFHTECVRDIEEIVINDPSEAKIQYPEFNIKNIDQALQYVQLQNYKYAQALYERYQIPFVVIGGQSTVPDTIKNYSFAHWVITSWLQELLTLEYLPPEHTFFSWPKFERILNHFNIDRKQYILDHYDQLERAKEIVKLAQHSKLFPDNGHPGRQCHRALAERILQNLC
jgi:hypothetical protein